MVCCKAPIHIGCLRTWFRANSSDGIHPSCPHRKQEVNRILTSIKIPNILPIATQYKLLGGKEIMCIIKDMYKAYLDAVEKGLRNRIRTFTFRNVDSIFLDPVVYLINRAEGLYGGIFCPRSVQRQRAKYSSGQTNQARLISNLLNGYIYNGIRNDKKSDDIYLPPTKKPCLS